MPSTPAISPTSASSTGPERISGGAANARPVGGAADGDEPGAALLHDRVARVRAAGLEPGVAGAERRVAGERQLGHGREDADAVVGRSVASAAARTSSPTGSSSSRSAASPRWSGRRRRARPRPGCRRTGVVGEDVDLGERALHRSLRAKPRSGPRADEPEVDERPQPQPGAGGLRAAERPEVDREPGEADRVGRQPGERGLVEALERQQPGRDRRRRPAACSETAPRRSGRAGPRRGRRRRP